MKTRAISTLLLTLAFCGILVFIYLRNSTPRRAAQASASDSSPSTPLDAPEGVTTTYVACYFQDSDGYVRWQWGLTANNDYFTFNGTWITTVCEQDRFASTANYDDLCAACNKAKSYYDEKGFLAAFFAADSNLGNNFPIVLDGYELFPLF